MKIFNSFFKEWHKLTGGESNSKPVPKSVKVDCLEQSFEFQGRAGFVYSKTIKSLPLDLTKLTNNNSKNEEDLDLEYFSKSHKVKYGADQRCSYFNDDLKVWNLDRLGTPVDRLKIDGISNSYTYYGTKFSSFAWHVEDYALYSINYLHKGAGKKWWVLPPSVGTKFEDYIHGSFFIYL